MNMIKVW